MPSFEETMTKDIRPASRRRMLKACMESPTYRKAYEDLDFLSREELRPVRLQLELLKPELILIEHRIESTIVVFGSARILPEPDSGKRVESLRREVRRKPADARLRAALALAERVRPLSRFYEEARRFAKIATRSQQGKGRLHFVIATGGGPGIMEASNLGAYEAGGKSIGFNITLPHEQMSNAFVTPDLSFRFHYFAIRKLHFLMRAKAMVAFPGGFGTMDELFESLTLVQTGKKQRLPVVLVGREFWKRAVDWPFLVSQGVISPGDLSFVHFVDTAEEAWRAIQDHWRDQGRPKRHRRKTFPTA
jgi:uncharacterized protein (TIGR00730 family)